jgi:hypothetical protein
MKALCILDLPNYRIGSNEKKSGLFRIRALETMFEAVTAINMAWMLANRPAKLYEAGVRYKRDPQRGDIGEVWCDAPTILQQGFDDCEGLSSFLAAEMRLGPNSETSQAVPGACVRLKTTRWPGMLHAIVFDPVSRRTWDPSRRLGMGQKAEF